MTEKPQAGFARSPTPSRRRAGEDGAMETRQATRLCSLEAAVGNTASCPEARCPFWEPGGAALDAGCAFERLGLSADASLASWLLEIRGRLDDASSAEEERAIRSAFHHLLNVSDE
jgi:hypothetical protein